MRLRFIAKCEGCFGVNGRRDRGSGSGAPDGAVGAGIGTEFGIGIGIVEPRFTPVILSESEGSR